MRLNELLTPRSHLDILQALLDELRARNWPLTDFESGSVGRTLLEAISAAIADLEALRVKIAQSGFLSTAEGSWLDLLAREFFGIERHPATRAVVKMSLTEKDGLGPYTLSARQLIAYTQLGRRYQNITEATLLPNSTLELLFEAEDPGAAFNVQPGTRVQLHTPLPGVEIEVVAVDKAGADEENDEALRERCRLRWHTLGGGTRAAYKFWALSAAPQVRHAEVLDQHPRGQGSVDVVIWGDGDKLPDDIVEQVRQYIQERAPLTADVAVFNASSKSIPIEATVWTLPGRTEQARAEGEARMSELQRRIGIGGRLYRSAIIEALFTADVVNVVLHNPANDEFLSRTEVPVFDLRLTYSEES